MRVFQFQGDRKGDSFWPQDSKTFIVLLNPNFNPAKLIIDSIVEKNGGKENFKFDEKIDDSQ